MQIFLVAKATGAGYSIEAGLADNIRHFDHHGIHSHYPCPANNPDIPLLSRYDVVEITHIDADTYVGLMRMAGVPISRRLNLELLERIDLRGSSVLGDKTDTTYLFMVGVIELSKKVGIPRAQEDPIDITDKITEMFKHSFAEFVELGEKTVTLEEKTYKTCLGKSYPEVGVGLWRSDEDHPMDPSRPYEDGYNVVVIYRDHWKSISIYCNPKTNFSFGNTDVAGVHFAGHPQACGSPRGEEFSYRDAMRVVKEIAHELE